MTGSRSRRREKAGAGVTDSHDALLLVGAYLCGAMPFGLWLTRLAGVDLRSSGSGNIGAANVARAAGTHLGALTLVLDVAKGVLPVLLARLHGCSEWVIVVAGLCAFYGHIFPLFLRFRGGKGVATAAGIFLAFSPLALVAALVAYATAMALRRIASLSSLSAAVVLPVATFFAEGAGPTLLAALVVTVTLFLTHRDNLRRLANGTEPQFRPR